MKRAFSISGILLALLFISLTAHAGLVVTEVMSDEPENFTSLEWIEFYNDSPDIIFLGLYPLVIMGDTLTLSGALGAYQYGIVCRKLYATGGTPAFEEVWGNNDGIWGDSPTENFKEPYVRSFPPLVNDSGEVAILNGVGGVASRLVWNGSVGDGISWEREGFTQDRIEASVDPQGCTPGYVNSITPLGHDLDLRRVTAIRSNDATEITFEIKNRSLSYVAGGQLSVYRVNEADPNDHSSEIRLINLSGVDSGKTVAVTEQFLMSGTYYHLGAELSDDDRVRNNLTTFYAPGADFPPVILTEVQPHPSGLLFVEWVEVFNRADSAINLKGWSLGDLVGIHEIDSLDLFVDSGGYLVLTEDSSDFRLYYTDPEIRVYEPPTWPGLNNSGDILRLIDCFGLLADEFEYSDTYDSNYTWSRAGEDYYSDDWGRSLDLGGTPGYKNVVLLDPTGSSLDLRMEPAIFSPDGDGLDDRTAIHVIVPDAIDYTLEVYDRQGRKVRTFFSGVKLTNPDDVDQESSIWYFDGLNDDGQRLPIGIYIVYFEAGGLESVKGSVVIAR